MCETNLSISVACHMLLYMWEQLVYISVTYFSSNAVWKILSICVKDFVYLIGLQYGATNICETICLSQWHVMWCHMCETILSVSVTWHIVWDHFVYISVTYYYHNMWYEICCSSQWPATWCHVSVWPARAFCLSHAVACHIVADKSISVIHYNYHLMCEVLSEWLAITICCGLP